MMRFAVRAACGLVLTLSTSSIAAAQVAPGAMPNPRDPLLTRPFRGLTFDATRNRPVSGPVSRPPNRMDVLLGTQGGGRLPEITTAPEPHGIPVPCVMRTVRVDPSITSNMPIVSVDERLDPKTVIKVVCEPRD